MPSQSLPLNSSAATLAPELAAMREKMLKEFKSACFRTMDRAVLSLMVADNVDAVLDAALYIDRKPILLETLKDYTDGFEKGVFGAERKY